MSQEQYHTLLSNLLKEKCALTKLRVELEGRKGKICKSCKGFGHLAQNCRNKNEEGKGTKTPQNKFEVLSSKVMQCGVEEKMIRSVRVGVKCYKCEEEGHKCRVCPLAGRKEENRVACPYKGKAHQEKKPVRLIRGKVQEYGEKEVRRVEEEKAVCPKQGEA